MVSPFREARVATVVYGGALLQDDVMDLGAFVSRKHDFMPPLEGYIATVESIDDL